MKIIERRKVLYLFLIGFFLSYFFYKVISAFANSLFFIRPARMNVVIYGKETMYYSIDFQNKQNYRIQFDPEVKVDIPGGYGQYRVGSLGKLVKLEKNSDIFQKSFSITTTTFIHYVFYQNNDEIYYENTKDIKKPTLNFLLFSSSNASLLDRIYLTAILFNTTDSNYKQIRYQKEKNEILDDVQFADKSFIRDSIGLLYNNDYRKEQKNTQIVYSQNYKTAQSISSLLEGNGIRVSDINKSSTINDCRVMIEDDIPSQTAKDISKYFSCPIVKGKTDVYDILFILGDREEEWKINN